MNAVLSVFKPIGKTPLQMVILVKEKYPEYNNETISYAGRLDPMAEGVLLLLIGDENKKRKKYEALKKTYIFEVLFGVETDSYDILGKITGVNNDFVQEKLEEDVKHIIPHFLGELQQQYPPYSSFHVRKKPLFYWARENKLSEISIPSKIITVYDLRVLSSKMIDGKKLETEILSKLAVVQGDFRQDEIIKIWQNFLKQKSKKKFSVVRFEVICSSGTYVRSLATLIGKKLTIPSLAYTIKRTGVGAFTLENVLSIKTTL